MFDIGTKVYRYHLFRNVNGLYKVPKYKNKKARKSRRAYKNQCKYGHVYSEDNTYVYIDKNDKSFRRCKLCSYMYQLRTNLKHVLTEKYTRYLLGISLPELYQEAEKEGIDISKLTRNGLIKSIMIVKIDRAYDLLMNLIIN